jgi:hypothetical protein
MTKFKNKEYNIDIASDKNYLWMTRSVCMIYASSHEFLIINLACKPGSIYLAYKSEQVSLCQFLNFIKWQNTGKISTYLHC